MPASLCLCLCKTCSDGCVSPTVMCQVCRSSRDGICSCTGRSKCRDRQSMKALPANKPETVRSKNKCAVRVGHLSEFARGIDGFNNATICQGLCFRACPLWGREPWLVHCWSPIYQQHTPQSPCVTVPLSRALQPMSQRKAAQAMEHPKQRKLWVARSHPTLQNGEFSKGVYLGYFPHLDHGC